MLSAISPVDGRYAAKTQPLAKYCSEYALIRYRLLVEVAYFEALCALPLPQLRDVQTEDIAPLKRLVENFSPAQAEEVKAIERTTNHDVKAVEYFLKTQMDQHGLGAYKEFIHFGLTSQDINNTATPLMLKDAWLLVVLPELQATIQQLEQLAEAWADQPMLARTHGQPASPTRLGKEIQVFITRLQVQLKQVAEIPWSGKFGGATGNFNAHHVAYPGINWPNFADEFVSSIGLDRSQPTTQIEHYDNLGAFFHGLSRVHTILIDLCKDVWTYIMLEYFKQKTVAGEVGSSAMPHKVNPIDFENAEGNLGVANALLIHLAGKLPISRLQRDLTDSTVLRNVGVPLAHGLIALKSIQKGLGKLELNAAKLNDDLSNNWMIASEAIQTVLRREGYPQPYEALKALTRGKAPVGEAEIHAFIDSLEVSDAIKSELKMIRPENYLGV